MAPQLHKVSNQYLPSSSPRTCWRWWETSHLPCFVVILIRYPALAVCWTVNSVVYCSSSEAILCVEISIQTRLIKNYWQSLQLSLKQMKLNCDLLFSQTNMFLKQFWATIQARKTLDLQFSFEILALSVFWSHISDKCFLLADETQEFCFHADGNLTSVLLWQLISMAFLR